MQVAELLEKSHGSQAALQKLQEVHAVSAADCQALRAALQTARLRADAAEAAQASSTQELQVIWAGLGVCKALLRLAVTDRVQSELPPSLPCELGCQRHTQALLSKVLAQPAPDSFSMRPLS